MKHLFCGLLMLTTFLTIGGGCCSKVPIQHSTYLYKNNIEMINNIQNATVALVFNSRGESKIYCTGVWISNDLILTANHCVEGAHQMLWMINSEEEVKRDSTGDIINFVNYSDVKQNQVDISSKVIWAGIVEKTNRSLDLALIKNINTRSFHNIASIDDETIKVGEHVHMTGHTSNHYWSYIFGVVSTIKNIKGPLPIEAKSIQVSAPIWYGNSGGGLFNSEGHLIGICSWIDRSVPNVGFFIHRDEILNFLQ